MTKDNVLIILAVATIGPLLTYIIAARRLSGKIKNSEASSLWEESRSIRQWSSEQIKELNQKLEAMETRLRMLEEKNSELVTENKRLREEKEHLERLLAEERAFNDRLRWEAERSPRRRNADVHLIKGKEDLDSTGDKGERDGDDPKERAS